MKETEVTVQIFDSLQKIDKKLKLQGYKLIQKYKLNDWYFCKFDNVQNIEYKELLDNSFLVRNIVDKNPKVLLCYKKKEMDAFGNVIAEEKFKTNLKDLQKAIKIFELAGMNNYCTIKNNSYVYRKDKISFVIQVIKSLGIFLELEDNGYLPEKTNEKKFEYMVQYVKDLGLKIGEDFSCKKVYMLVHKNK